MEFDPAPGFGEEFRVRFQGVSNRADHGQRGPGDVVFHALHVPVDGVLLDLEKPEEAGERLMPLDDRAGDAVAFFSEDRAAVFLVLYQSLAIEAAEHVGDAGLGDAQTFRDIHRTGIALGLDQMQDLLEVVVHGDGAAGALGSRGHAPM